MAQPSLLPYDKLFLSLLLAEFPNVETGSESGPSGCVRVKH